MNPNTAMDPPVLELKIVSANDLKKPGPFSSAPQPYVVVSISGTGAASPSLKTTVDTSGGRNPTWNHPLTVSVPATGSLFLRLQILSRRSLAADKFIGEVCVPLRELLQSPDAGPKFVSYQVKKPSGRSKGVLTFSYRFAGVSEPVTAYPAMPPSTSTVYPAPMPSAPPVAVSYGYPAQGGYGYGSYGYGYPIQTGYGYGYGYGGQVVQPNRKKSSGLGLGAGLLGGALAGLLVGDLVSDAAFDFGGGDSFF